jgi:hypothetical protein
MHSFVVLPIKESMMQCSTEKHDQSQGYMTFPVINHAIMKSITIVTTGHSPGEHT